MGVSPIDMNDGFEYGLYSVDRVSVSSVVRTHAGFVKTKTRQPEKTTVAEENAKTNNSSQTGAKASTKVTKASGVHLDIPVGDELVLRIPGLNQTYRGKIVGADPYDYIIARVRMPSDVRRQLARGGQVVVKFAHQGTVFGFRGNVVNAISSPASLLFIEYPDTIEKVSLRQNSRLDCNIDGLLESADDKHECIVVNVSESGCRISARAGSRDALTKTDVGDSMVITMTLGRLGTITTPIAVRNISSEKGIITIGAMFLDISDDEVAIIQQYLDKLERLTR